MTNIITGASVPEGMEKIWKEIPTPSYVVDENRLKDNLEILAGIKKETGCKILLAQKAFSMFHFYPLIAKYLDGSTASGLFEAKLGAEEMPGEVHVFSAAYKESEFEEIARVSDHIVFNSFTQWEKYKKIALENNCVCGLRINPEHSTQDTSIYDPCSAGSRMGVRKIDFREDLLDGISGLHFHTLCEQGAEPLAETLEVFEKKFGKYLHKMKWVNFGGGHHITRPDYNVELLKKCIRHIMKTYNVMVYVEPGEAIAYHAGDLVATVLDVVQADMPVAILDTSAACHMPDVIEMPYRPPVYGSGEAGEKKHTYRMAGPTCLAGDIIGEYSFDTTLQMGDRIVFGDMAIYSMVKNNTFNGMPLPSIIASDSAGNWKVIKEFGYNDFKYRLS